MALSELSAEDSRAEPALVDVELEDSSDFAVRASDVRDDDRFFRSDCRGFLPVRLVRALRSFLLVGVFLEREVLRDEVSRTEDILGLLSRVLPDRRDDRVDRLSRPSDDREDEAREELVLERDGAREEPMLLDRPLEELRVLCDVLARDREIDEREGDDDRDDRLDGVRENDRAAELAEREVLELELVRGVRVRVLLVRLRASSVKKKIE